MKFIISHSLTEAKIENKYMYSPKIARVTIEFYEGQENKYEIVVSARKIGGQNQPRKNTSTHTQHWHKFRFLNLPPKTKNDRSCKKDCRCVSFYNLHPRTTDKDVFMLCSDFGNVQDYVLSMWNDPQRKSMWVWMENSEQSQKVIEEYDGKTLDNNILRVMNGHIKKSHRSQSPLDMELKPKRENKVPSKIDTRRIEELDHEIEDYMKSEPDKTNAAELDREYMKSKYAL